MYIFYVGVISGGYYNMYICAIYARICLINVIIQIINHLYASNHVIFDVVSSLYSNLIVLLSYQHRQLINIDTERQRDRALHEHAC